MCWRFVNMSGPAVGFEEDDDTQAVPAVICWWIIDLNALTYRLKEPGKRLYGNRIPRLYRCN